VIGPRRLPASWAAHAQPQEARKSQDARTPEELRAQAQRFAKLAEHRDHFQELLHETDVLLVYWGLPEACPDERTAGLRRELP
jgi:hypothetical protein